jgi:hypothetical protein
MYWIQPNDQSTPENLLTSQTTPNLTVEVLLDGLMKMMGYGSAERFPPSKTI